jgi:uncharacterized protein
MTTAQKRIISKTAKYAEAVLGREATGHDWLHVKRVWLNAKALATGTGADLFIVELGALLHDIADWKFHGGDATAGPKKAAAWLRSLKLDEATVARVADIVAKISFKGAKVKNAMDSLEGKIVQDADRLDALGAIGIARAFAYGGSKGREIYNPGVKPVMHATAEAYSKGAGPTINHFYEKLLLLEGLMNTRQGRLAARGRHKFMQDFLKQFHAEVSGRR